MLPPITIARPGLLMILYTGGDARLDGLSLDGASLDALRFDNDVRLQLFQHFVAAGEPPLAESLAARMHAPVADVRASLERLASAKGIVLQPESREILMANPLCAVIFRVLRVGCHGYRRHAPQRRGSGYVLRVLR
jgi:hypothetical protein